VNTVNEFGFTPLILACLHGEENVVRHILESGASIDGETPPNSVHADTQHWTPLTYCALSGNSHLASVLLDKGARVEGGARVNEDRCTETPLQVAAAYGNGDMVTLLLSHGADPFLATTVKDSLCYSGSAQRGCYSAISVAAAHGQRGILHKLLSHPLSDSSATKKDMLSLEEILEEGVSQGVIKSPEKVLVFPTHVDNSSRSSTMSSGSAGAECTQVVKLTRRQVKVLQEAMYHSAESRHLGTFHERGLQTYSTGGPRDADVNTVNEFGFTPLILACLHGEENVVRHILESGASIDGETPPNSVHADTQHWTPLTYCALSGNSHLASVLLDKGARVEGGARVNEDRCTETPLQVAAAYGNGDMVTLLLSHGADPFLATTVKDSLCYSGSAQRGCYSLKSRYNAICAAS
ncbi:unnamed protein product, partial [Notodromas monacha]